MGQVVAQNDRLVDEAVERLSERAFAFLERLVAARSDLGREAEAQEVVSGELAPGTVLPPGPSGWAYSTTPCSLRSCRVARSCRGCSS